MRFFFQGAAGAVRRPRRRRSADGRDRNARHGHLGSTQALLGRSLRFAMSFLVRDSSIQLQKENCIGVTVEPIQLN